MRLNPASWDGANFSAVKKPRYIMRLSFSDNDQYYFTSHQDCPLPPGAAAFASTIYKRPRGISQRLYKSEGRSDIGAIKVELIDRGYAVSDLLKLKRDSGIGVNNKKIELLCGFEGQPFDDYVVVTTQLARKISLHNRRYRFACNDIQRELRKKLFVLSETSLTTTVEEAETTINVSDTSKFQMVQHGSSYTDAKNSRVGYVRIEDEIIRYTGMTATSFTGCYRGALNTAAARHVVDPVSTDRPLPVREYIYLEMPAVKLALALMTGDLYGQPGERLPDKWHLGIDPVYINEADYTGIGNDVWNPADDTQGVVLRFEDLKKQDGRQFIWQQLMLLLGAFQPVYADGRLGLKRATRILSNAAHIAVIGVRDLAMKISDVEIRDGLDEVSNFAYIDWNYNPILGRTTRRSGVYDPVNAAAHGVGKTRTYRFLGLHGSRHSAQVLQARFDTIHDSFSAPPKRLRLRLKHRWNSLEVGDIVRVQLPIRDNVSGGNIDRAFEVQFVQVDWNTGDVTVELFGSTGIPGRAAISANVVLPDDWYSSEGVDLETVLPSGAIEMVGGVGHLSVTNMPPGGYEITGGDDMGAANSIFYYLSGLTIDPDVILKINNNVQFRVRGHLAIDGLVNGRGRGLPGGVNEGEPGIAGYVGITESMGGAKLRVRVLPDGDENYAGSQRGVSVVGKNSVVPANDGIFDGANFSGLSGDYRGTSGSGGIKSVDYFNGVHNSVASGNGGNSGAAFGVVCRGLNFGITGTVDISGVDGTVGEATPEVYGGSGSGGWHGAFICFLDGVLSNFPIITESKLVANIGITPLPTESRFTMPIGRVGSYPVSGRSPWCSYYRGMNHLSVNASNEAHSVSYIVDNSIKKTDISQQIVQPPVISQLASGDAYLSTAADGARKAQIYLEITPSPNEYLSSHEVQFKKTTADDSAYTPLSGILSVGVNSVLFSPPVDGVQYTVRVRALNRFNKMSSWVYGVVVADGKGVGPAAPSGLVATSVPNGIRWEWINSADDDIKYTEVYISGSNNRSAAILYNRVDAETLTQDGLTPGDVQYCWIFHRDRSGNQGEWYPALSAAGISGVAGAVNYNGVSGTPTALSQINSTEGAKLAGVEDGATVGADWNSTLINRPTDSQLLNQLLDPSTWITGPNANPVGFSRNGAADENEIVLANGPHGNLVQLWKCVSNGNIDADGGWNGWHFDVDTTKTYRFTLPFMRPNSGGTTYFGLDYSSSTSDLGAGESINNNPYFFIGAPPQLNRWYLAVGFLHPADYSETVSYGAVYDYETGVKVGECTDFKHAINAAVQRHRAYLYYAPSAGLTQFFGKPRVDIINGSEPSIESLLQGPAQLEKLAAIAPGADVTAQNTAAAIANQGDLATQSTADFSSQIIGPEKPADNADVTKTIIELLLAIQTGGLQLGGDNAKILLGDAVGYLVGRGLYAGMSGTPGAAKPGFHVGDPATEQYFAFSPVDGNAVLGRNTELRGASSYNNNAVYYESYFDSADRLVKTVTQKTYDNVIRYSDAGKLSLQLIGEQSPGDHARVHLSIDGALVTLNLGDVRAKTRLFWIDPASGLGFRFLIGGPFLSGEPFVGIEVGMFSTKITYSDGVNQINTTSSINFSSGMLVEIVALNGTVEVFFDGVSGGVVSGVPQLNIKNAFTYQIYSNDYIVALAPSAITSRLEFSHIKLLGQ